VSGGKLSLSEKLWWLLKPKINSVEDHPQLSNNGHPVDGGGNLILQATNLIALEFVMKKEAIHEYRLF
jgi:hypothetical protein